VGGVSWTASYVAGQGLRLALAGGGNATAAQAQALLQALAYQNTAASVSDGARVLTVSAQDSVNNTTASPAKATLILNAATPTAAATKPLVTADANGDGVLGDQFIVSFSELVNVGDGTSTGALGGVSSLANWSVTAGKSLGVGATLTALNPITVGTSTYAKSFVFKAGSGFSYTTGTTFTITSASVVDTASAASTSANGVVFTMTDIVAPSAPTPPLQIAVDNFVNFTERRDGANLVFSHAAVDTSASSSTGGTALQVFRDGLFLKSVTATSTSTTVNLKGDEWGADGVHSFTVKVVDAAGNLSPASSPKLVTVDTAIGTVTKVAVITDASSNGSADKDDVVQLTFSEAMSIDATSLPTQIFGTNYSVSPVGGFAGQSQIWNVTLGNAPTLAGGQSVTTLANKVTDAAGNSGNITFSVDANVFNTPGAPVIGNVTTDNVISGTERGGQVNITILLSNAKANDVVKLMMDGVQVGSVTVTSPNQASASITLDANIWGADGERTLTASVERTGSAAVFSKAERHVYVAADAAHWSSTGVLWFDPDTLLATGSVSSLTASAGGSTATQSVANAIPTSVITGNGRRAINYDGSDFLSFSAPTSMTLSSGSQGYSTFIAVFSNSTTAIYAASLGSDNFNAFGRLSPYGQLSSDPTVLVIGGSNFAAAYINGTAVNAWNVAGSTYVTGTQIQFGLTAYLNGLATKTTSFAGFGGAATVPNIAPTSYSGWVGALGANVTDQNQVAAAAATNFWNGLTGDTIYTNSTFNNAQSQEVSTYLAQKYGSIGNVQAATGSSASYDLSVVGNQAILLDDVLNLANAQGAGADTVTTAGADWVNAGAGNDTVRVKDLAFRSLDGGKGFDTLALSSSGYTGATTFVLADHVSNSRGQSAGTGGLFGRANETASFGSTTSTADNVALAPDLTLTADEVTLRNQTTQYDFGKNYTGLVANTSYTFSVWVKLGTASNVNITANNTVTAGTIAGDKSYNNTTDGLSTTAWKRIDTVFVTDQNAKLGIFLGSTRTDENTGFTQSAGTVFIWGAELNLTSALPPVPSTQQLVDDARVNTNGFHKLLGFEHLDFSQNTDKQTVTIAAADVDQMAEKNLSGDPQAAANTSNLYVELGSNDYLVATGFANNTAPTRGFWKDVNGVAYDRKYSVSGGTIGTGDTANLYVRGGDDAPELGNTATVGSYTTSGGGTTINLAFNEAMAVKALVASDFTITNGSPVTATSASMTASGLTVGYNGSATLSGVLRLQYSGSQLVDNQGDQLRFKDISLGTSSADIINGAGRSTNQALIGNAGNDVITGGSGDDLLIGGLGNDTLKGGAGADIFRFIKYETGSDTITDFNLGDGDKIDLRGLLADTGFSLDKLSLYLNLSGDLSQQTLKVDTLGSGNFGSPDLTVVMSNPSGINDGLATLIDQRVFMV
jgi:hypothetical protein